MAGPDKYDSFMDRMGGDEAQANVAAAQGVAPEAAVRAFKSAPTTGVEPTVGMTDPAFGDGLAEMRRDASVLDRSPSVRSFASASPAHVAATRDDWSHLATIGEQANSYMQTGGPLGDWKRAFDANIAAGIAARTKFQKARDAGDVGGAALAGGEELMTALSGLIGVPLAPLTRPLAEQATRVLGKEFFQRAVDPSFDFRTGTFSRPEVTQQAAQANTEGLIVNAIFGPKVGLGVRKLVRPVIDEGTLNPQLRIGGPGEIIHDTPVEPLRPPGVRPDDNGFYVAAAESDAEHIAGIEKTIADSASHARLPALTQEFLDHTPVQSARAWIDPQFIVDQYAKGHTILPQYAQQVSEALSAGREVEVPLSAYLADASGKPYAEEMRAATRFREDGVSVDAAKELPAATEVPAPREIVPPEDIPSEAHAEVRTIAARVNTAVDEVFQEHMLSSLFTDAKALKMSKGQFERYDVMLSEAKAEASDRVLQRTYDQIRRERTPGWKVEVAQRFAEVEQVVAKVPALHAYSELTRGKGVLGEELAEPIKLAASAQLSGHGRDLGLPRSMFASDGLEPDDAASLLGFDSGVELLQALAAVHAARGEQQFPAYVKGLVEGQATAAARAALGYDVSPEGIAAAAREAAVLPGVEAFLTETLRDLADAAGEPLPFNKETVKIEAKRQFDLMPMRQATNPQTFTRAMWKLGTKTEEALSKGDFPAAFRARQLQLLNYYQLDASRFLANKVRVGEKTFRRLAKKRAIPALAQPFLDQLHTYLPLYGYPTTREPQELAEALGGVNLGEFVNNIIATNADFPTVPLVDPAPIMDLKVADYWNIRAFVFAMNRYGREMQTALKEGEREQREGVVEAALASIPPGKPPQGPVTLPADDVRTFNENIVSFLKSFDAFHRKAADFVEWMDAGDPLGVWAQNIVHPLERGADTESRLHRETYAPAIAAWGKVPMEVKRTYNNVILTNFNANGTPIEMKRRNIIRMALYAGTAERLAKAAAGFGVSEEEYLATVNAHITPEEVSVVEKMWEGFAALAPAVSETRRALTGEGLRRDTPQPVMLGGKMTSGGYVPLKYNRNPALNPRVLAWEAERDAKLSPDGLDQLFGEVMLDEGFAKEVTNYTGALDVELGGLAGMFNAHIKYAAYARAVSDVRRFVYDPRIAAAIHAKWGPEYMDIIPSWLNGIIRPMQSSENMINNFDKFVEGIGRAVTTGSLALNYSTLVAQAAGFVNGVAVLSDGNVVAGTWKMLGGYKDTLAALASTRRGADGWVNPAFHADFEDSEFLRSRYGSLEQNMTETLMEADDLVVRGKVKEGLRHLERVGFQAIGWTEFATVSYPLWKAAKRDALTRGLAEDQAILYANRMVTKTQGGGRRVDLAAVQRSRGMLKLAYAFQSYFNQQYQLMIDVYRNGVGGGGGKLPPPPPGLEAEMGADGVWVVPKMVRYRHAQAAILAVLVFVLGGVIGNFLQHKKNKVLDPLLTVLRPIIGVNSFARVVEQHFEIVDGKPHLKNGYDASFGDDLYNRAGETITSNALNVAKLFSRNKSGSPMKLDRPVQNAMSLLPLVAAPFGVRVPGAGGMGKTGEYLYELQTGEQAIRSDHYWGDLYFGLTGGPQPEQKVTQRRRSGR